MKFSAPARVLAEPFALAASLCDVKARKRAELEAVTLSADDEGLRVTANVADFSLFSFLPVSIADGGTVAVSGGRLAALLNGFAADAAVTIARKTEESFASLSSGRSRYKLPLVPIDQSRNSPKADNRPTTLCANCRRMQCNKPREQLVSKLTRSPHRWSRVETAKTLDPTVPPSLQFKLRRMHIARRAV